jgi:hypothetical protein
VHINVDRLTEDELEILRSIPGPAADAQSARTLVDFATATSGRWNDGLVGDRQSERFLYSATQGAIDLSIAQGNVDDLSRRYLNNASWGLNVDAVNAGVVGVREMSRSTLSMALGAAIIDAGGRGGQARAMGRVRGGRTPPQVEMPAPGIRDHLPPPELPFNKRFKTPQQRFAAEGEAINAQRVAGIPNELVLTWGGDVSVNGRADISSVNTRTGTVTLWDSKARNRSVTVQESNTFRLNYKGKPNPRRKKAIANAIRIIEKNTTLSPWAREKALENLSKGIVETRTAGHGNARNSVIGH